MERRSLGDGAGRVVATYLPEERDGRPCADLLEAAGGVAREEVAAAAVARRRGWLLGTEDGGLASALRAAGALAHRQAAMLELDLAAVPARTPAAPPPGTSTVELREVPDELGAVQFAAYPPGHPDHRARETPAVATQQQRDALRGAAALPGSRLGLRDGRAVGAALLTRRAVPTHPEPIAWLSELFRLPGHDLRGLGSVLLDEAVLAARAAGMPVVGLAVSAGNPARRLYESRGFTAVAEGWTLRVPE